MAATLPRRLPAGGITMIGPTRSKFAIARRTSIGAMVCVLAVRPAAWTQRLSEADIIAFARPPIPHGFSTHSAADRIRVAGDRNALAILRGLLDGRVRTAVQWDSAVVLWWLAESGDAKYLPVFLKGSRAADTTAVFISAVYGLARSASSPESSRRIEEVIQRGSENARRNTIALLAAVTDADSRRLLRGSLSWGRLEPAMADMATRALARAEAPRETARWPALQP